MKRLLNIARDIFQIPKEELPAYIDSICAVGNCDQEFLLSLIELVVNLDLEVQLEALLGTNVNVSMDIIMAMALQLNSRNCAEVLMQRNYQISKDALHNVVKEGKVRMAYMLSKYLSPELVQYMLYVAIDYDQVEIVMLLSYIPNNPKVDDTALQLAIVRQGTSRESSTSMTALEILIQSSPEIIRVQQIGNYAVVELANMVSNQRDIYCLHDHSMPLVSQREIEASAAM